MPSAWQAFTSLHSSYALNPTCRYAGIEGECLARDISFYNLCLGSPALKQFGVVMIFHRQK
jgi:hypothetical protein